MALFSHAHIAPYLIDSALGTGGSFAVTILKRDIDRLLSGISLPMEVPDNGQVLRF
jgi:hypothetical protein